MRTKRQGLLPPVLSAILLLLPFFLYAADEPALPRLAVVEFTGNAPNDATTVRTIVESVMIDSGNFTIVSTYDIDQILKQQGIALSSISSQANITKLQRENIKYIVTGTVDREGAEAIVSLRMLDVSNARFFPNSPRGVVNMSSMTTRLKGVSDIASAFLSGMTGSGEQVVRSGSAEARQNSVGPVPNGFVRIEGGTFTMGSPASEVDRSDNEAQHQVKVSAFYMGKYEVSQAEYEAVMGTNPSSWKGAQLPVEQVSWYDAVEYCNKRSEKERLTPAYTIDKNRFDPNNYASTEDDSIRWIVTVNRNANGYRLPTEAEWEYACRAGTTTPFSTGNNITTNQANYNGNYPYNNNAKGVYREKPTTVGSFAPNRWGLYDMHGNVWEWCWDWYGAYSTGTQPDPLGAASGSYRVLRGGSWYGSARNLRSAYRNNFTPSGRNNGSGFRVVRP